MSKKLLIWILQTGEPLHSDNGSPRPMRAMNLANSLTNKGHKVVLWSSGFYHQEKRHRSKTFKAIPISNKLEIRLIPSPGYKRNVSIFRLIDHFILALNLKKQLKTQKELPDAVFVGYPPIEAAFVITNFIKMKGRGVPTILDIKDQWPPVLVKSFPKVLRPLVRIALSPYYLIAKKTIRDSTVICGISAGFLNWSLNFANRNKSNLDYIAPLTSPKEVLNNDELKDELAWWGERGVYQSDNKYRIIFIGSFSRAFDFDEIFRSAKELSNQNVQCEFVLCGDGEFSQELKIKEKYCDNVKIIEWIDQPKIIALSQLSSAFIAPYISTDDFVISVPNKVIDALKFGLPILSPLKGEVSTLIKDNKVGLVYNNDLSLDKCVKILVDDKILQKEMSDNSINLYDANFEFNKVYGELIANIEELVK